MTASGQFRSTLRRWLVTRQECWVLTLPAKAALVLALALGAILGARWTYPFLAITDDTGSEVLIMEGWITERLFEDVAAVYRRGGYHRVLIVISVYKGDILDDGNGLYFDDYLKGLLVDQGVPAGQIDTLFCPATLRDRTYHCARVARRWLREHREAALGSVDVVSLGPHARRSRLLYELAFEKKVPVGVIALDDRTYDPRHWWSYSEGMREVITEALGYVYAKLVFSPPDPPDDDTPFEVPNPRPPTRVVVS